MIRLVWRDRGQLSALGKDWKAALIDHEALLEHNHVSSVTSKLLDGVEFLHGPKLIRWNGAQGSPPEMLAEVFHPFMGGFLYHGLLPDKERAEVALRILRQHPLAESDYAVELSVGPPKPKPPVAGPGSSSSPCIGSTEEEFSKYQLYLEDSPTGVGARRAWSYLGGRGERVRLADLELGFHDTHAELTHVATPVPCFPDENHGTMVLGVCCALENSVGIIGIAPGAEPEFRPVGSNTEFSVCYPLASSAIAESVKNLAAGDVILLELEGEYLIPVEGSGEPQSCILPIERSPDVAFQIQEATNKGIYIVEAAGNGGTDLAGKGLPSGSDAIVVGAGLPGVGTQVADTNYGDRVDLQGWGSSWCPRPRTNCGPRLPDRLVPAGRTTPTQTSSTVLRAHLR